MDPFPWLLLFGTLRDAITTVTAPVLALLFLVALATEMAWLDPEHLFRRAGRAQPVVGAAVSAIPGCAGSVTLTRLYGYGIVSAATLYASHLSTLGDASFVLWAARPLSALYLSLLAFVLGAAIGLILQTLRAKADPRELLAPQCAVSQLPARTLAVAWLGVFALTLAAAALRGPTSTWLAGGSALTLAGLSLRAVRTAPGRESGSRPLRALLHALRDASEITLWVVGVDVAFALANTLGGGFVAQFLRGSIFTDVLLAAAIGLIPGCGPQIAVASLYIAGDLPFAALLANTLSQHGDAIFPLIRRQRRLALQLTLTSAAIGTLAGFFWAAAVR